jgi:hypothetical protein
MPMKMRRETNVSKMRNGFNLDAKDNCEQNLLKQQQMLGSISLAVISSLSMASVVKRMSFTLPPFTSGILEFLFLNFFKNPI